MLRKILVSAVPLTIVALLARIELVPGLHPCIPVGNGSLQVVTFPRHADLHVSFTDDPAAACAPMIHLSHAGPADYRIFVRSRTSTAREAAALIVGGSSAHPHLASASL